MCLSPIRRKIYSKHYDEPLLVDCDCGKCCECYQKRQKEWFTRFAFEKQYWLKQNPRSNVIFVTLTFSPEFLPTTRDHSIKCIQIFRKNLNRKYNINRYCFVQEFGEIGNRVHFHGLIFGSQLDVVLCRKLVDSCWPYGRTNAQIVQGDGCFYYVAKYTTKICNYSDEAFSSLPWKPYFACSKRPALGVPGISDGTRYLLSSNPSVSLRYNGYHVREPRSKAWIKALRTSDAQWANHTLSVVKQMEELNLPPRTHEQLVSIQEAFDKHVRSDLHKKSKADLHMSLFPPNY